MDWHPSIVLARPKNIEQAYPIYPGPGSWSRRMACSRIINSFPGHKISTRLFDGGKLGRTKWTGIHTSCHSARPKAIIETQTLASGQWDTGSGRMAGGRDHAISMLYQQWYPPEKFSMLVVPKREICDSNITVIGINKCLIAYLISETLAGGWWIDWCLTSSWTRIIFRTVDGVEFI